MDGLCNPPWVPGKLQRIKLAHMDVNGHISAIIDIIKFCGKKKDISTIRRIYAENDYVVHKNVIANTLIRSFARCGALQEAQEVFRRLLKPNIVSWNALIAGYAEQGYGQDAIICFREMQKSRLSPDSVTYACVLKACVIVGALEIVEEIHVCVRHKALLDNNIILRNTLVNAYAKCGAMKKAEEVFEQFTEPDVISWNVLIAGYVEQGFHKEAIVCLRQMQKSKIVPNSVTYICSLKACTHAAAVKVVEEIHASVNQQELLNEDVILGNTLVSAYVRCGAVKEAQEVFDQLPQRDVISWNVLIAGYVGQELAQEALACFTNMEKNRVSPDSLTYTSVLKGCAIVGAVEIVREIHARVKHQLSQRENIILGSALVNAYARCGSVEKAQEVFDQLMEPDVISWNALISGYAEQGFGEEALACFRKLQCSKQLTLNSVSYICALKACTIVRSVDVVEEIHALARQQELMNNDIVLWNTLVNAYVRCDDVKKAQEVFEQLLERDVVSWNVLIAGYAEQGYSQEALACFRKMQRSGVFPDSVTYTSALKACAIVEDMDMVEEIHATVTHQELLNKNIVLASTLINAYARCGAVIKAREVLEQYANPDVILWNALIAGYAEEGFWKEAIACFREMQQKGLTLNEVACACVLRACAILGTLELVEEIHARIGQQTLLHEDIALGNALINAYARCGMVNKAKVVFEQLAERDVASWTALLAGYAIIGCVNEMLDLFNRMLSTGIFPSPVTFIVLLNGCSHGALLEEGLRLFNMIGVHGFSPRPEHYACMVDLFGRAGLFDNAICFVLHDMSTLLAFLGACLKWVEVEHGRWAFEKLIQLDRKCTSAYVCMSNLFVAAGMMKEAHEIELLRVQEKA